MQANSPAPAILIDKPSLLEETAKTIAGYPSISVDTESNSLYVYREQVCLIQISTPDNDFLIDTLALKDLSALAGSFADPAQEKIFHASEYDVICMKRDYGFTFANIFDTMIAARVLGEPSIGLASLLKSRLGIDVDKKYQRANWGIRPLPKAMLEYASQDSHYLYQLRMILEKELQEKHLLDLAREDFRLACEVQAHSSNGNSCNSWKVAGSVPLKPQEAAILHELCEFREKEASQQNLPPFKIISNETLVRLSQLHPTSVTDLIGIKGLTVHLLERYGPGLFAAIYRGETAPPLKRPRKEKPDEQYLNRFNALREWRKNKGLELKVESDVILPRDHVELIASVCPRTINDLNLLMKDIPYRSSHFGKEILGVLKKQEMS
jgi:ribonuclease D